MKQKRKIFSKFTAVFLAVITLLSMFPVLSVDAATTTDNDTIYLEIVNSNLSYQNGWNRPAVKMKANDKVVYCVQPEKDAPKAKAYNSSQLKQVPESGKFGNKSKQDFNKALYYSYGGTWFDKKVSAWGNKSMKDLMDSYTDINPSKEKYYLITHTLLSYMYGGEKTSYGDDMYNYVPPSYITAAKELYNKITKAPAAPVELRLYYLNTGSSYQIVLLQKPQEKLKIVKQSSNTSVKYTDLSSEFTIYTDSNCTKKYGTIKTDANGVGTYNNWADVPFQPYYAKETKAPTGFQKSSAVYQFKPTTDVRNGSAVYQITVPNTPLIHLQLTKSSANPDITNDNGCYSLEGAVYGIYKDSACNNIAGQIVTDKDGYGAYVNSTGNSGTNTATADKGSVSYGKESGTAFAYPTGLENNAYYCKEITAPPGYDLDDTVYTFKDSGSVSSDGVRIFRAVNTDGKQPADNPINDPVGIVLQKKNAITGETTKQGLEGAIFEVQYYAQEIDKDYDVDTSKGETAPTLESTKLKRTWYIKTDSDGYSILTNDTNYLVDNTIYNSDELYLDNGFVTIPVGTVVIREVKEPDGYTKSPIVFYRQISEEKAKNAQATGTPINIPIDEQPANAYIGLHKMNKSGQGVKGAVYGLYSDEKAAALVSQLTTDTDGKGTFDFTANVNQTYYIKEISAPTGYELDTTIYPVTPTIENATVDTALVQDIYEDSVKGDIIIKKSSNDGVVSNLYFALSDNLGNTYNAVATDSTGTAKYTGLPVYDSNNNKISYTVKELGFKTTPGTKSFGGFTWTVKAENCIKYKGAYYEGVSNKTFSDCEYAYSRYYYGNQTEAIQNSNGYTKTLTDNSTVTYSFSNTVKTTDIEINKQSYDGRKSGFWFKVVDQTGRNYGEIVTNDNGIAKYSEQYSNPLYSCITVPNSGIALKLNYRVEELGFRTPGGSGSYYFPDNYIGLSVSDYKSDNLSTSTPISFDVYNKPDTGSINIVKSSDDGYIANLWFKVSAYEDDTEYTGEIYDEYIGYDTSGNAIHEFYLKTDSNGRVSSDSLVIYDSNGIQMSGLPVYVYGMNDTKITYKITELGLKDSDGTYYLPDRYVQNDDVSFNLLDNRSYTYTCHNSVKTGKLQIQKISEDNEVDNIWFKVESSLGYKANIVTDSTGFTTEIDDLPIYVPATDNNELVTYKVTELGYSNGNGTYTLPSKYVTPKTQTVTLNTDGTVKVVHISNTLKRGSVTLYKEDSDGNALTGSQWELYNASDDSLVSLVQTGNGQYQNNDNGKIVILDTDNNGRLIVRNLKQGDYYFSEKTPPDGKMTYGRKIEFTISADSDDTLNLTYTAIDDNIVMYDTGSNGNYSIYFLGFTMLAISIVVAGVYIMNNTTKKHGRLN